MKMDNIVEKPKTIFDSNMKCEMHKEIKLFVRRNKVNLIVICEHRVRS